VLLVKREPARWVVLLVECELRAIAALVVARRASVLVVERELGAIALCASAYHSIEYLEL
jgi:hypothetical protein